jgi:hypothetical protein
MYIFTISVLSFIFLKIIKNIFSKFGATLFFPVFRVCLNDLLFKTGLRIFIVYVQKKLSTGQFFQAEPESSCIECMQIDRFGETV